MPKFDEAFCDRVWNAWLQIYEPVEELPDIGPELFALLEHQDKEQFRRMRTFDPGLSDLGDREIRRILDAYPDHE